MNSYPMEPGALEGALSTVGATHPDTAASLRAHIEALETEVRTLRLELAADLAVVDRRVKDKATIKALVDALERGLRGIDPFKACLLQRGVPAPCTCFQCEMRAALRLAGRLP